MHSFSDGKIMLYSYNPLALQILKYTLHSSDIVVFKKKVYLENTKLKEDIKKTLKNYEFQFFLQALLDLINNEIVDAISG